MYINSLLIRMIKCNMGGEHVWCLYTYISTFWRNALNSYIKLNNYETGYRNFQLGR